MKSNALKSFLLSGLLISQALLSSTCLEFATGEYAPFVYLSSRSEDLRSSIQVNFHSQSDGMPSTVYYDTQSRGGDLAQYALRANGRRDELEGANRYIHHVDLQDLEPDTTYYFALPETGSVDQGIAREFKFKTLSSQGPLRLITGGDMGTGADMSTLVSLAASYDPDLILLGGDIAYANGDPKNTDLWDKWLTVMMNQAFDSEGHMIPLILALGNHEVRWISALAARDKAPFFYRLFDQTGPDGRTYFKRILRDDVVLLSLDSGFISPAVGVQAHWLKEQLSEHQEMPFKLALYHAPLYPSHRGFNLISSLLPRIAWRPIFEKYELTVGMENHDHAMKRTHYLHKNKATDPHKGVLYIGDGCFGKSAREVHPERDYLATALSAQHFWVMDIGADTIDYRSIDIQNQVIDQHRQNIR